jgi:hypothetical protein
MASGKPRVMGAPPAQVVRADVVYPLVQRGARYFPGRRPLPARQGLEAFRTDAAGARDGRAGSLTAGR